MATAIPTVLALVAAGCVVWRDSRIDLRFDTPVFSTVPGEFDCAEGLTTVLEGIGVDAQTGGSESRCSTIFKLSPNTESNPWTFEIQVRSSEFDTSYGAYREVDDSRTSDQCTPFPYGTSGDSRYIDGHGGFCLIRNRFSDYSRSRSLSSQVLLSRFGHQVEIGITAILPEEAEHSAPDRFIPFNEQKYLEYRTAMVYSEQLDPAGTVDEQLRHFAEGTPPEQGWLETHEEWCAELSSIDMEHITNTDEPAPGYEVEAVEHKPAWSNLVQENELHCSATWAMELSPEWIGPGENPWRNQTVGLSITAWPWGPEKLDGRSDFLPFRACESVSASSIEAGSSGDLTAGGRLQMLQECEMWWGHRDEVLFLIDGAYLGRIWVFNWDERGSMHSEEWNDSTLDAALLTFLEHLSSHG